MNLLAIAQLLQRLQAYVPAGNDKLHTEIVAAMRHCQLKNKVQAQRKLEFKLRADEKRELLR